MLLNVVYTFSGCDSPVSATGSLDDAKAGDAIPLKFSLGVAVKQSVPKHTFHGDAPERS